MYQVNQMCTRYETPNWYTRYPFKSYTYTIVYQLNQQNQLFQSSFQLCIYYLILNVQIELRYIYLVKLVHISVSHVFTGFSVFFYLVHTWYTPG